MGWCRYEVSPLGQPVSENMCSFPGEQGTYYLSVLRVQWCLGTESYILVAGKQGLRARCRTPGSPHCKKLEMIQQFKSISTQKQRTSLFSLKQIHDPKKESWRDKVFFSFFLSATRDKGSDVFPCKFSFNCRPVPCSIPQVQHQLEDV